MKYMDWAAMGAASSAYAESSRARAEVVVLWEEIQRLREDIDSQKYKQAFQQWVEELIYQFSKIVKAITTSPGEPINDFIDISSFLHLIEAKELDTSHIRGFDHKEKFEETLLKAQNLLTKLETNEQVQKYIRERERQQEAARREEERLRAEKSAKESASAKRDTIIVWSILSLSVLLFVICLFVDFMPGVFVSIVGVVFSIYAVINR